MPLTREMSVGLDRQSTVPPDDPRVPMTNPTPPGPIGEAVAAEQRKETVPKTFRMNRNSTFKRFMTGLPGWREGGAGERVQLGHWDVYKTHPNNAQYDSWPRSCTNCLDNIWTYYQRVFDLGLQDEFPETFFEWRSLTRETIESNPIWFLKNIWGVHGKGITLISSWDEYQAILKDPQFRQQDTRIEGPDGSKEYIADQFFLQRGMVKNHLVAERKYCLRTFYLTLGDGRTFLFRDTLGYVHAGAPFNKNDNSWNQHVSHYRAWAGEKDTREYFTMSIPTKLHTSPDGTVTTRENPEPYPYEEVMGFMIEHSKKHSRIWGDVAAKSQAHPDPSARLTPQHYQVWGCDYLVKDDLTAFLIEVNAYPNLNHDMAPRGSGPRPHEMAFRSQGFDRDILRILGVDDCGAGWIGEPGSEPCLWEDVTDEETRRSLPHIYSEMREPEPQPAQ